VPKHIHRGADIAVDIARKHLRVAYKDADGKLVDVVCGELTWDVHKEESMWSLVPGEHVHVSMHCTSRYTDISVYYSSLSFNSHFPGEPGLAVIY